MIYKYQLILLGDVDNAACGTIKKCFLEKINELGLSEDMFEVIYAPGFWEKYSNKQPAFVFYFGSPKHQDRDVTILERLLKNGDAIFPVYFGSRFEAEIPEIIHIMNGNQYVAESDCGKYVNHAFESLKLLRTTRKLFISYRRTDSSAVANQLFDALVRQNYDVFLDTYSINPAENFQEELHHRMTDCDVLIQLRTTSKVVIGVKKKYSPQIRNRSGLLKSFGRIAH